MRKLSESFIHNLKAGFLSSILERIKKDDTLLLAIRDNYINIYYRGGNILRIAEDSSGKIYNVAFDEKYDLSEDRTAFFNVNLPKILKEEKDTIAVIKAIPVLKEIMDFWYYKKHKSEREFQQVIVRENNFEPLSIDTEYFVTDIEVADKELKARFDLSAIKWNAGDRKIFQKCSVAFFEMKYGDDALDGRSGLIKHLDDITEFLGNRVKYEQFLESIEIQFQQLDYLDLLDFNHSKNLKIELNRESKPEFVFILANHNPRSAILKSIITSDEFQKKAKSDLFDLRFYHSTFAGYALHSKNMLTLNQFKALL